MNVSDEQIWEVFQTVYEPGSRMRFEYGQDNQPDVIDGMRAVAEWARKEALGQALDAIEGNRLYDNTGDPIDVGYMCALDDALSAVRTLAQEDA